MDRMVRNHFRKVDPTLFSALERIGKIPFEEKKEQDFFANLCREIIGQQLSGTVVKVLFDRFVKLHPGEKIEALHTITLSDETLRNVGISRAKIAYIKDLAQKVLSKEIDLEQLKSKSDEEVVAELITIKGIGPWTAEMFLMFTLFRQDVFSMGDLGLQKAIQRLYQLDEKPDKKIMKDISDKWIPYRSYACRILWRSLDDL